MGTSAAKEGGGREGKWRGGKRRRAHGKREGARRGQGRPREREGGGQGKGKGGSLGKGKGRTGERGAEEGEEGEARGKARRGGQGKGFKYGRVAVFFYPSPKSDYLWQGLLTLAETCRGRKGKNGRGENAGGKEMKMLKKEVIKMGINNE